MDAVTTAALAQLDELLGEIEPRLHSPRPGEGEWCRGTTHEQRELRTRASAAIERLTTAGSAYALQAYELNESSYKDGWIVARLAGVLKALRADYAAGYMRTVQELVHADLFADFLEMADELLSKNYKDAAAVITGSVLEEHLRKLAAKHGVPAQRGGKAVKADTLNGDLAEVPAYNKLTQKSVTAWLDLRNKAAHGHYDQYDRAQVEGMLRDVRGFMERLPA